MHCLIKTCRQQPPIRIGFVNFADSLCYRLAFTARDKVSKWSHPHLKTNSPSGRQKNPSIWWNPEVRYRLHNIPPLVPIMRQMNTVYAFIPLQKPFEHYHPIYTYIFQVVSLLQAPHQKPACTFLPFIHATSPAHLIDDVSTKCNYRSITSFTNGNKWTKNRMWHIQAFLTSFALGNIREIRVICVCIYCHLRWVFRSWIWGSFWLEPISSFHTAALVVAKTSAIEAVRFHQLYVTIPPPRTTKLHKGQYTRTQWAPNY